MKLRYYFQQLEKFFICKIEEIQVFPFAYENRKFFRVLLSYSGYPIKIYINDIKVPKHQTYVCETWNDSNSIKIKVRGILNSKSYFIEMESAYSSNSYLLKLPGIEKSEHLREKTLVYGISRRAANIRLREIRGRNGKKTLTKKLGRSISNPKAQKVLRPNRLYFRSKKYFQLNNSTNRPTSWKN